MELHTNSPLAKNWLPLGCSSPTNAFGPDQTMNKETTSTGTVTRLAKAIELPLLSENAQPGVYTVLRTHSDQTGWP
jgi:hypothetical protein